MIFVDDAAIPYKGKLRYHLAADSLDELHEFAAKIGVKKCWYHNHRLVPHYDVNETQRLTAIDNGAVPMGTKEIILRARGMNADI